MTAKEMAQKVIAELPDETTLDDIQYHLYVLECIQRGDEDLINGRTMTDLEVRKGLEKWLK
jgi:hypothetical protein